MPSFAALGNDLYTGRRSVDFVHRWKTLLSIAAVVVTACVLVLVVKGFNPGIEFRGGSEYRVSGVATTDQDLARQAVAEVVPGTQPPAVSVIGGDSIRVQTEALGAEGTSEVTTALAEAYDVDASDVTSSFVGPVWGEEITQQALIGIAIFLVLVSLVISVYFRDVAMAGAALVALLHDLVVTAGVYALVGFEVTPASVIGFLTILGFSLYDTVVVFDKVREQTTGVLASENRTYLEQANLAVNQTVVRSINTSVVAALPIASILFIGALLLGAGTLRDLSLALFVGTLAGTYSSIFVAPAFLGFVKSRDAKVRAHAEQVLEHRREQARLAEGGSAGDGSAEGGAAEAALSTSSSTPASSSAPGPRAQRTQPRRGQRRG
ncbi:protein translocase subunit SecF [uncultured Pseudokineococcus sp.]|uniref:protein translocase subunit SecF n=1 Tax=uncultured Pseudokineococcus sp. TaxID=1642928 RepID=UPI0026295C89|nr:protein translocase subunit SecF [uncultured Pseudokineococcus sp.]